MSDDKYDYELRLEFYQMADNAEKSLKGDCPLIEDEALVWADKEMMSLRRREVILEERCKVHGISIE